MTDLNAPSSLLSCQQLTVKLSGRDVLQNIDLSIGTGELIGLIGPNGAGKSTLLKTLMGLQPCQQGQVYWQQQLLTSVTAKQRAKQLAYLPQQDTAHWALTVEHLVGLGRSPWHKPLSLWSDADRRAIEQALTDCDLLPMRKRPITELSGGEVRRALLARVFAGQPQCILADEPINALDPYHQLHVMELLQAHCQRGGTAVAALHDLSMAARFCQRLILLDHGQVVADGTPATVLQPQRLAQVYGVEVSMHCDGQGVSVLPTRRIEKPQGTSEE